MPENVFIAWGRNEAVAAAVADSLSAAGYVPTVGGATRSDSALSFYINSNVIRQMDASSSAIILVQRIYDADGKPTAEFRPNLMFEWGYLQRRLRADALHVFLINIGREELPSDLLNAYTQVVTLKNPTKPTAKEIVRIGKEIATIFLENIAKIDFDGLEIIKEYDSYRNALWELLQRDDRRYFNPREVGYFLLHMIQPAFYRQDLDFIKNFLRYYSGRVGDGFSALPRLLNSVIRYYELTDINLEFPSRKAGKLPKEYHAFEDIAEQLESLSGADAGIFNIFEVVRQDFLGLAYMQVFLIAEDASLLARSIAAFQAALASCAQFQSIHLSNRGFIKTLWESYIERNIGRAYALAGDAAAAKQWQDSGNRKRVAVKGQLEASGVSYMAEPISLEIGLSQLDQAVLAGASEAQLTKLIEKYLEQSQPRGVNRMWDRLHGAMTQAAQKQNYDALSARLAQLKE